MANKNILLKLIVTAKDEASGVLSSFQAKALAVSTAIAGYFSIDFLKGIVGSAGDFEAAMSRIKAATGASAVEFASLKKAAEDAGANTKFTSVEAAAALEGLAKSGLSATKAVSALPGVLALAEAGDISLAQSADYVTQAIFGMGVAASDTGRIADVLAKGANESKTSVKGLADALSYAAPTARSLGLSLEQTVGYIGSFANAGIDASRAGTALNAILSQFQDPASKFRTELSAAGITTGNFDKALRQLAGSGKQGEKAILAVGLEAGPALRGMLNQGIGALDDLTNKLKNAKGAAAETATTMGDNLNGALSGLSSAWDALKIKLGEPALEVVTGAVKDLTASLQGAISNGTVTKFGEALRSGFASGIEWARKFAAEVDPKALAEKLQLQAEKIGAGFDEIGKKAKNTGDILSVSWGVMSAGGNAVMAVIFKLAEGWASASSVILSGLAKLSEAFAKVTFGDVSKGFTQAAEEIRLSAGGMGAVAEEYGRQATASFISMSDGAVLARSAWESLHTPATVAAERVAEVGTAATLTADQLDKAGANAEFIGGKLVEVAAKAATAGEAQKKAADTASVSVKELRAEYERLVAAGDTQKAAEAMAKLQAAIKGVVQETTAAASAATTTGAAQVKAAETATTSVKELRAEYERLVAAGDTQKAAEAMVKLQAAIRAVKKESSDAADAASALTAAYQAFGLKSQSELKQVADSSKRNYDAIRADGTATTSILQAAFVKYAEAAIAANNGIAPASIKAEAALRGVSIEADETGKSIAKIGAAANQAGKDIKTNMNTAAAEINKVRSDAEKLASRLQDLKSQRLGDSFGNQSSGNGSYEDLRRAGVTPDQMKNMGYSSREIEDFINRNDQAAPGTTSRTVTTSTTDNYTRGISLGLTSDQAKVFATALSDEITRANAEARGKAQATNGVAFGVDDYVAYQQMAEKKALETARRSTSKDAADSANMVNSNFYGAGRTVTVNLTSNGKVTPVQVTNQAQADALLRALEEAGLATR